MLDIIRLYDSKTKKAVARGILEALPEWFGIAEAREEYIAQSAAEPFAAAYEYARANGYCFIQVKTVQMGKYADYDKTNLFYKSLGFMEFELFPTLWDERNPCQIYVMAVK